MNWTRNRYSPDDISNHSSASASNLNKFLSLVGREFQRTHILQSSSSAIGRSHHAALASTSRFAGILRLLHLHDHQLESFGDVFVEPGASLGERTLEFLSQFSSFFCYYLSLLMFEITLIPDDDQWNPIGTLASVSVCYVQSSNRAEKVWVGTR